MSRTMERVASRMCMQKDVGINGNLFGGTMMAWMDEACAVHAKEETMERFVVTMHFGEMVFHKPVREGDVVAFYCGKDVRGKTSLTFSVEARVEGMPVLTTDCTFVVVDEKGAKKGIDWEWVDERSGRFRDP